MTFDEPRPRRRPSLTPMIDVVFLLLVFFMLASRFGMDMQIPLTLAGASTTPYSGPPRLVDIDETGIRLNGGEVEEDGLAAALEPLMEEPTDVIILRPGEEVPLQRLVAVMDSLAVAGLTSLVVLE
ncbi:ExbD/TolR family protein [Celeribacter indicus]|uniref:Biopolymer transport protein ExbD/TolR n=1 Tax=Celeribacter indicus TaxID=1208324 RepID=A0A0B5DWW9_9RHOB|nr:biopolymer transporter ExbD [Celeribacter indicus]AJE45226.1 biopolymer transport protein ExbD/TolR [Celeribacter indicus]SDX45711.1 biopolymer transport protein ExbD [Celeribacter indicus]